MIPNFFFYKKEKVVDRSMLVFLWEKTGVAGNIVQMIYKNSFFHIVFLYFKWYCYSVFCVLYRKYFVKNFFVSGKKVVLKFGSWQDVFYFCP
ncbi:hypothetical protein, partial [Bacteroides heparinolyticus]|uniref:hypothetical protein n=1 Tax=Prevotella heparinolytica TaxID=28113 RepID=UPI0035A0EF9F